MLRAARIALRRGRALAFRWLLPGQVAPEWNNWNLLREIAWYGVLSGISTTFASVFALRLGASDFLIGLLSSLPALVNVIFQIPAARLVERERDRRRVVLSSGFLLRLPMLLLVLVPFLPRHLGGAAAVWITALGTIPAALGTVSFTAMLADVVGAQDRARVVSRRNALLAASSTVSVLLAGKALDALAFPLSYQLIFLLAFGASLVSLYYLSRVAAPRGVEQHPAKQELDARLDLRHAARAVLKQRQYVRFCLGLFLYHWGLHFPIALYAIYRVRTLGLSEGWIGALATVESAVTIGAYFVWGRLAHRRGPMVVLMLGTGLVCLYPINVALSRSAWPLLAAASIAGIAGSAFNLGLFNSLLEVSPEHRRAMYVALFNALMNVAAFVSPLLGTTVAGLVGIRQALWLAGLLRILGFIALARLLH